MKKILLSLALVLSLVIVFAGCGNQTHTHTHEEQGTLSSQQSDIPESENGSTANDTVSENSKDAASTESKSDTTDSKSDSTSQSTQSNNPGNAKISRDKAKEIALKDAGVKKSDIYDFDIELDYDDGILHYDIDFEIGGKEYEYVIDAQSGNILLCR